MVNFNGMKKICGGANLGGVYITSFPLLSLKDAYEISM